LAGKTSRIENRKSDKDRHSKTSRQDFLLSTRHNATFFLLILPGCLLSGLLAHFALSTLLSVPSRLTIPLSVILSILIFAVTKYYSYDHYSNNQNESQSTKTSPSNQFQNITGLKGNAYHSSNVSNTLFAIIYAILLVIVGLLSYTSSSSLINLEQELFVPWNQLLTSFSSIVQLGAAISLTFFVPGYAIVKLILSRNLITLAKPLPKILLAYLFSMLITGLTQYIVSSTGVANTTPELSKAVIISIYTFIAASFVVQERRALAFDYRSFRLFLSISKKGVRTFLGTNLSISIVFASLFALIIFYTYYLNNGVIQGDQWFHHGRALLINSSSFRDIAASGADTIYPPFFSALLAAFFNLSGSPSVNAYVSINFLNILPVFAFYYFFTKWIPENRRRAVVLASTLFMLSSGFGWIHVLHMATNEPATSDLAAHEIFQLGAIKTHDIRTPTTFTAGVHPTSTTPLIIIALPAGFVLLGIIKEDSKHSKLKCIAIVVTISTLGIFSTDEFYLFIIIASILPLVFRLPDKNFIFASFLSAFSVIVLVDVIISPQKYYTVTAEALGAPLLALSVLFVCFLWLFYATRILYKPHYPIFMPKILKKIVNYRIRLILGIVMLSVVAYLYLFTFIVWEHLSIDDVRLHVGSAGATNIPWYLYPMQLGVAGLLGLAFILSYIFKKFEKEVFIFGIIVIVSLLTGPYYNEYRFSKYVMIGMAGFASLLVYDIIILLGQRPRLKALASGVLIGLVITSSSFSILLFAGYKGLAIKNPEFTRDFHRIDFPSSSEMNMFNLLHNELINLKTDNVAIPSNEVEDRNRALFAALEGFSGIPRFKLSQSPFTMNASTLEGFYDLLEYSEARYILLPGNDYGSQANIPYPILFSLENFQKAYQDNNYTILVVPALTPPSEKADVALIYQGNEPLPAVLDKTILPYDNESFNIKTADNNNFPNFTKIKNGNTGITLFSDKKEQTLWSKPLRELQYDVDGSDNGINYVEARFQIIGENRSRNNVGILWENEKNKEYLVSLTKSGLELLENQTISNQINNDNSKDRDNNRKEPSSRLLLSQNTEIIRENGTWYTIKIAFLDNAVNIYVNDELKIRILRNDENYAPISKVGIRTSNNIAEFQPLKVGRVPSLPEKNYQKEFYRNHYYLLTMLALSKSKYDTFIDDDFSAFSKKNVILPFDPPEKENENNDNGNGYLEFVKRGGTLIVIDGKENDNSSQGMFSKLLDIQARNESKFNGILYSNGERSLNISGFARDFEFKSSSGTVAKSFYVNNNQKVAPFSIEKNYGYGKIIFVNADGYFDAIMKSPEQFFSTLANIPSMIDLIAERFASRTPSLDNRSHTDKAISDRKIIGGLEVLGETVINSSSILFLSKETSYNLYAKYISISNQQESNTAAKTDYQHLNKNNLKNTVIKDLKLYGPYEAIINTSGLLRLPTTLSHYDYFAISAPTPFNMTLKLSDRAYAEFIISENNNTRPVRVANGIIHLHEVRSNSSHITSIPILMKSPEIGTNGTSNFKEYKNNNIDINGKITAKFNHIDHYYEPYRNGSRTQFITYIEDMQLERKTDLDDKNLDLRIPGDISESAKAKGIEVPWQEAMLSNNSIISMISIPVIIAIGLRYVCRKENKC
jgi:hypothetical protein